MALGDKLGKLSIAILENFVEDKLGKKFVDELRAPTDKARAVATALEHTEDRFKDEFDDQELAHAMFDELPADKKMLGRTVGKFYDHPTDPDFPKSLEKILTEAFKTISKERLKRAVDSYVVILTEELALADETFREHVRALSDLRSLEILRRIEQILQTRQLDNSNQPTQASNTQVQLRSLHQLPPAPADFTGREEQLKQVLDALAQHKGAAISGLTGMGGIGKTALGLVAAHQIADQYPDAQIFLDLRGATEPLSASDALRQIILSFEPKADLREATEEQLAALYQSLLADKRVLVFMDNAREAGQVRPMIPPASCALIVTSRWHFTLPHMDPLRLDVLPEDQAISLLHELCGRIGDAAKDIVKLCGRLPLALRIAGTFLAEHNDWSPVDYADKLKAKGLKLLHGDESDATLNLELVLGYSYEQLSLDEQKYWRMLAVFPASFKREAAAAVWELEEDMARDLLSKFNRMSLLDYDGKSERYNLHDLLANYARTRLSDEEVYLSRTRHAVYYSDLLSNANQLLLKGGENTLPGIGIFDTELSQIMAGQRWSANNLDDRTLAMACNDYAWQWNVDSLRLHPRKYIEWIKDGLKAARKLNNKRAEGAHLGNLGLVYAELGDARKAIEFYVQDLAIAHEIGDRPGEGACLGNLGLAYADLGDVHKAVEYQEQALAIDREIGDRRGEGTVLGNLGAAYADLGDVHKAIEFYEQALVIDREIGDRRGEGTVLGNLGAAYAALGEVRKAIEFYEKYLAIAREIGDRRGEGNSLFNMSLALYGLGEEEKAILLAKQAFAIFEAIESPNAKKVRDILKQWGGGE